MQGIIHKAVNSEKGQQEGFGFFQPLPNGQPPKKNTNIYYFNLFVKHWFENLFIAWVQKLHNDFFLNQLVIPFIKPEFRLKH